MPGPVSETYLRPADSAASFGSTIVCTSVAVSSTALPFFPKQELYTRLGSTNPPRTLVTVLGELEVKDAHEQREAHGVCNDSKSIDHPQRQLNPCPTFLQLRIVRDGYAEGSQET